jgi:hypothetical protein
MPNDLGGRSTQTLHNPAEAIKNSLMHKQKPLCNGAATGECCKHYWAIVRIVPSHNPDFLKSGEKLRFCRAWGSEPLEFDDGQEGMAVKCNIFEPDAKRRFDPDFETYSPLAEPAKASADEDEDDVDDSDDDFSGESMIVTADNVLNEGGDND